MRRLLPSIATFLSAMLIAAATGPWAGADELVADGDGATPIAVSSLSFGNVCAGGAQVSKDVLLGIRRTSSSSKNIFKDGSPVTFDALRSTGAGLTASMSNASGSTTVVLPSDWASQSNDTIYQGDSATGRVRLTPPSAPGSYSGSATFRATGTNQSDGDLAREVTVPVTATVVTCTAADTTPPVLSLPPNQTVEATGASGGAVTFLATATDANPTSPAVTCTPASGSTFAITTTVVSCSATDAAGNRSTGTFSITVRDTTAPTIAGTPSGLGAEATDAGGAIVSWTTPTATDLVDGDRPVTCSPATGSTFALGATTVSCSAADTRNNVAATAFNVTVGDSTRPVLAVPASFSLEATGPAGAVATFRASAMDSVDGTRPVACSPGSGSTFALGATPVTCRTSDESGNEASDTFTVTVVDTTVPTLVLPNLGVQEATSAAGASVTYSPAASDLVSGAVAPTCAPASGSTFAIGTTRVSCTATDGAGNAATDTFDVTVVDTTPPSLLLPADVLLEATGPSGTSHTFEVSATDTVAGTLTPSCDAASPATFPVGATLVTCTAEDTAGNPTAGSFTVQVVDTTAPVVTVPEGETIEATGPDGATVDFSATADDIVDGALTPICAPASGTTFPLGVTEVSCVVTDTAGNESSDHFAITVVDTVAPTIHVPADIVAEAVDASGADVDYSVSAQDVVSGAIEPSCSSTSGDTFPLGETTVTCTAIDEAGNAESSTFSISVVDTTAPSLTVPDDVRFEASDADGAVITYTGQSATDSVDDDVQVECLPESGTKLGLGTHDVTCRAEDDAGNVRSGSFTVVVSDTTAPWLTLFNVEAEATSPSGADVSYETSATDAVDGSVPVDCSPESGERFPLGASRVECSAADSSGNTATGSLTVTVVDTSAPSLTVPDDLNLEATSPAGAVARFDLPTASDLADPDPDVTCDARSGATFRLGATAVRCTAVDAAGNEASVAFVVIVVDTTAPDLTAPRLAPAEAIGPAGADVSFSVRVTDAATASPSVTCTPESGSSFPLGETTVVCSAVDAVGNLGTTSFDVVVVDTTNPVVDPPGDVTAEATSAAGAAVTFAAPTATDVVSGPLSASCSPASGSTFPIGSNVVTCSATDGAGNTGSVDFAVMVRDTTGPSVLAPATTFAFATSTSGGPVTFGAASAVDVVDGAVAATCSPASGSTFPLGRSTVACSARDAAGNRSESSFDVVVGFDIRGGLLAPVNQSAVNTVKNGSTVPLKWQVPNPAGGWITSTSIVTGFVTTRVSCSSLDAVADPVDATSTGGTALRYDTTANQFIQNWQTPKTANTCYRVNLDFAGGHTLTANFQLK